MNTIDARRNYFLRAAVFIAAVFVVTVAQLSTGVARADWSDNFSGNQAHNPAGGEWGYYGLTLAAVPQEIPNWTPQFTGDRVVVPRPGAPGGQAMFLAAGWVASQTGTTHHYRDVRVAATVGVGNNGGLGNNNWVGVMARANDFDVYVLTIDHNDGTLNLIKSLNTDATNPITVASTPISFYAALQPYYIQLDALDTAGGTRLVGRIYEDASRNNLFNTIFAFDDAGSTVPGPPLIPFYSGFVAQASTAVAVPTPIDAFFDDISSTTLRPGDVNLDGTVNRADVARLVRGFGMTTNATWDDGDLNGDGRVGLADVMQIQNRLSTGPVVIGPPVELEAAAVPEPGSLWLAAFGGACGFGLLRRRFRQ